MILDRERAEQEAIRLKAQEAQKLRSLLYTHIIILSMTCCPCIHMFCCCNVMPMCLM